jgi:hypothetical protein
MAIDKNQVIFFAGKKMTIEEFMKEYDIEGENEKTVKVILDKLEKKGKLRYLTDDDQGDKAFKSIYKELELEAKIDQIEEDAEREAQYKASKQREGRLVYEEIEVDLPTEARAAEMLRYVNNKLKLAARVEERDGIYTIIIANATESDVAAIKRHKLIDDAGKAINQGVEKVTNTVLDTAAFAADKVVLPATKAGLKAALGLTKTIVKTSTSASAALISGTTKNVRSMSQELKYDEDVLRAKKDLVDAKDAVMRMFKRNKFSSDIRIK